MEFIQEPQACDISAHHTSVVPAVKHTDLSYLSALCFPINALK